MAEILDDPLLTADYRQAAGVYDEMCAAPGVFRPHWDRYIASLSSLGGKELAHRWQIARQRIRDNGVSYNVYGDPLGTESALEPRRHPATDPRRRSGPTSKPG